MLSDLRQALRQLVKTPGFTFTALVTLALGIGATTAIFTLVQQVMLKSLPVVKPEELYRIGDKIHCCNWGGYTQDEEFSLFSWELYKHFRDNTPAFEQLAALQGGNAPLGVRRAGTAQQAETRNGEYVSGNFFQTVGVGSWIGRVLTPSDDHEGAAPVAVMSYHVWKERYGGDRLGCRGGLSDQRTSIHRGWRGSAGILWGKAGGMGHAGFLAAAHGRNFAGWSNGAAEKSGSALSGHHWEGEARDKSEGAGGAAARRTARLAGQPSGGYECRRRRRSGRSKRCT